MTEKTISKIQLFLLSWQDMTQQQKNAYLGLVQTLFTGGNMNKAYYEAAAFIGPDVYVTKTKVYQLLRYILDISTRAVYDKLSGKSDFSLREIL